MTNYQLFKYQHNYTFNPNDFTIDKKLRFSLADFVDSEKEFFAFLVDPTKSIDSPIAVKERRLIELPLIVQYGRDDKQIDRKTFIQDPINNFGPFVLDRAESQDNKIFRKGSLRITGYSGIEDDFMGHKWVYLYGLFFVGNPRELFDELKSRNYAFDEKNMFSFS